MSCTDGTVTNRNQEKEIQMCVLGVRSRVKTEGVSEVEAAIEKAFPAIAEAQPEGVRYASIGAGDGATFVALELEREEEPRERALT
jgi:hypothetical protein